MGDETVTDQRRVRPLKVVGAAMILLTSLSAGPVRATWQQSANPGTATGAALTLSPAAAPQATAGCQLLVLGPRVSIDWTATSSLFATGYDVLRSTSATGPYTVIGSTVGRTMVTLHDDAVAWNTTYHYRVRAKSTGWQSAETVSVSATTPLTCVL